VQTSSSSSERVQVLRGPGAPGAHCGTEVQHLVGFRGGEPDDRVRFVEADVDVGIGRSQLVGPASAHGRARERVPVLREDVRQPGDRAFLLRVDQCVEVVGFGRSDDDVHSDDDAARAKPASVG
jgi:hypothetical protein